MSNIQLVCNSTGTTVGLVATTGTGSPNADIVDVSQTSSGLGIKVTHSVGTGTALSAQNSTAAGTSTGNGIHALTAQSSGSAIWAQNTNGGNGITAQNTNGGMAVSASTTDTGVPCIEAANAASTGTATGVSASTSSGAGYGVFANNSASSGSGIGLYADGWKYSAFLDMPGSPTGLSLYAVGSATINGNLVVNGSFAVGGSGKSFVIDHPLDPANRRLYHHCVESPDRKNVYDGVVEADAHGEAVLTLPTYFEALNGDFRYQLTALGSPAPGLHVKSEVSGGRFVIAGAAPKQRVSWQVTGIRHDAWAKKSPTVVEDDKRADEKGFYLHPEAHGQPKEKRIGHADEAEIAGHRDAMKKGVKERASRRPVKG